MRWCWNDSVDDEDSVDAAEMILSAVHYSSWQQHLERLSCQQLTVWKMVQQDKRTKYASTWQIGITNKWSQILQSSTLENFVVWGNTVTVVCCSKAWFAIRITDTTGLFDWDYPAMTLQLILSTRSFDLESEFWLADELIFGTNDLSLRIVNGTDICVDNLNVESSDYVVADARRRRRWTRRQLKYRTQVQCTVHS